MLYHYQEAADYPEDDICTECGQPLDDCECEDNFIQQEELDANEC